MESASVGFGRPQARAPIAQEDGVTEILISGAGIAGRTVAYWLLHYGFGVTIVERAHRLGPGGSIIDFWGAGYDVAVRMGLISELDRKSQIRVESWPRGRVDLVGDAASCVSLLAGEGSGLAMIGAYVLAGELHQAQGRHEQAFTRYEALMRPFVTEKQQGAARIASALVPSSSFGIAVRSLVTKAFGIPFVADRVLGNSVIDHFSLPDYA